MLNMIKRILHISGRYKSKILLGIFFNFLKSVSMAMMLLAIYLIGGTYRYFDAEDYLHFTWRSACQHYRTFFVPMADGYFDECERI